MPEPPPRIDPAPAVAIAGCGAVTAVGCGVPALQAALLENRSGLAATDRFSPRRFPSGLVGAADWTAGEPRTAGMERADDPAHALAAEALAQAGEEARAVLEPIPARRIGLVLSTTKANIEALERQMEGRPCPASARRHLRPELLAADLAAGRGAAGPVCTVSLACVSGLAALQQGMRWIQRGEADAVWVTGVDHLSAFVVAGFGAMKALDPAGCRPFDRNRRGLTPGEAGAAVVLVRGDLAPPSAIFLRGAGTSNDANHLTGPSRDGSGLALAIRSALAAAGWAPGMIQYVNAHGTGTAYNDAMEMQALRLVFGDSCPPFSGAKGMLGHTLGAAGVVETILCVLAMRNGVLPGTPRLLEPAEGASPGLLAVPRTIARLERVLKLSVGFGGINGALVLSHG